MFVVNVVSPLQPWRTISRQKLGATYTLRSDMNRGLSIKNVFRIVVPLQKRQFILLLRKRTDYGDLLLETFEYFSQAFQQSHLVIRMTWTFQSLYDIIIYDKKGASILRLNSGGSTFWKHCDVKYWIRVLLQNTRISIDYHASLLCRIFSV